MRSVGREPSLAMIGAVFDFDPLPALASYPGPKLIIDTPHGDGPTALHRQLPDVSRKVIAGTVFSSTGQYCRSLSRVQPGRP